MIKATFLATTKHSSFQVFFFLIFPLKNDCIYQLNFMHAAKSDKRDQFWNCILFFYFNPTILLNFIFPFVTTTPPASWIYMLSTIFCDINKKKWTKHHIYMSSTIKKHCHKFHSVPNINFTNNSPLRELIAAFKNTLQHKIDSHIWC